MTHVFHDLPEHCRGPRVDVPLINEGQEHLSQLPDEHWTLLDAVDDDHDAADKLEEEQGAHGDGAEEQDPSMVLLMSTFGRCLLNVFKDIQH